LSTGRASHTGQVEVGGEAPEQWGRQLYGIEKPANKVLIPHVGGCTKGQVAPSRPK